MQTQTFAVRSLVSSLTALLAPIAVASSLCSIAACGGDDASTDTGRRPDGGPEDDASSDPDGSVPRDGGPRPDGSVETVCNNPPIPQPAAGACGVRAGDMRLLIRGDIVAPSGLLKNGHVLVEADGTISCAACDCSSTAGFATATVIECPSSVVSPGLINAHDHITFDEAPPADHGEEVYEHRHDWRRGLNNHTRIPSPQNEGGNLGKSWAELRNIMAGTTSMNASGGAAGLTRNLDQPAALQEGLNQQRVYYSTFPLGDTGGQTRSSGCGYTRVESTMDQRYVDAVAYTPHISEGIGLEARNEFLCLSSEDDGGNDVVTMKTGVIHGIGLVAADYSAMAADGASLIWSPRSNIDLYGHTAQVTTAVRSGVRVALGTDWTPTGSMNMLRELRCAAEYSARNLDGFFSDRALVDIVTKNGAEALGAGQRLGSLAPGFVADVAIFDASIRTGYRAILEAEPEDVVLVLRGGRALYGDEPVMNGLIGGRTGCERVDVCGTGKLACVQAETGSDIAALRAAIRSDAYELFYCNDPPNEPSCVPFRPGEFLGVGSAQDSDGDGVGNDRDNCPDVFNPPRPLDQGAQADGDNDGDGDACDVCPLDPMTASCRPPNPDDRDRDGVPNGTDNCPDQPNPLQEDAEGDGVGDVCDRCPNESNPMNSACTVRIYDIKRGMAQGAVRVRNALVTGVGASGYFVQVVPGDAGYDAALGSKYSGIFVYTGTMGMKPAAGDRVDVDGQAGDFFGQTQISNSRFTATSSGNPEPAPVQAASSEIATGGGRAEELEGVLVEVTNVAVTDVMPAAGPGDRAPTNEFVVEGGLRVDDFIHLTAPFPVVGTRFPYLRGILRHANNDKKLEPRNASDVAGPSRLLRFEPGLAFVVAGSNGVPPGGFAVVLDRPATSAVGVALTSAEPARAGVPAMVTVPMGSARADVPVTAGAAGTSSVAITAMYDGVTVNGSVMIYDDATPRSVTALTLTPAAVSPSATARASLELNLPAPAGGAVVVVTVDPVGLATAPASLTVPQGARTATFAVTAGAAQGSGTVAAAVGGRGVNAPLTVSSAVTRPPMPGDLLITEVMRNPSVSSNEHLHEWFEVYNQSTDAIALDGVVVQDNQLSSTIRAPAAAIPPGGYAVIAYLADPARNGGVTAIAAYGGVDIRLANDSDKVAILYDGVALDEVVWARGWPGPNGTSMCLKAPYDDNSVQTSWGDSVGTFGGSDRGSPGMASTATNCP